MKSKAKRATKAEQRRMARLKEMWCICCRDNDKLKIQPFPTEVHHLLSGNKRRGHAFTIPLCAWHHRGFRGDHFKWTAKGTEELLGPSLARTSRKFHETYGSDNELLDITNELLEPVL